MIIGLLFSSCKSPDSPKQETAKKPNLLIVMSDQHSYDMLGCYGNTQVKTPNLDQFASEGVRFSHSFTNQPVCTPFRGMILSGMHPLKNGAFVNDVPLLPNETKLLGQVLKEEGYQTAYIGKWHLLGGDRKRPIPEGPLRYGFDLVQTNNCHVDYRPGKCFYWNEEGERSFFEQWEVYGQTRQALDYLDQVDPDKPFALIVSWHPPHDWGKFKGEDGKMHYRYETIDELMDIYTRDSIQVRPGMESTPDLRRMYHGHMAMVSGVDRAFGMLMDKLDSMGVMDNTLTLFTADHGDMLESHQAIKPKQYPHDYSARIPMMIKYPEKIKEPYVSDLLVGALDIMPTVLSLLDIESEQNYDGQDLSSSILTKDEDAVAYIPIWNYRRGVTDNSSWRGVVTKSYTFAMTNPEKDTLEEGGRLWQLSNVLFDRQQDPHQLNNLYDSPEKQQQQAKLEAMTMDWMKKYRDEFYNAADFLELQSTEDWMYKYEHSPYELFLSENK